MRTTVFLAASLAALVAAGGALAAGTGAAGRKVTYSFLGRLTATPANGSLSISVEGGNRRGLRVLLGQPATQTFSYGGGSEFLRWSQGKPTVVGAGDLAAGDYVRVHVRAPRGSSLADVERRAAALVGDRGTQLTPPDQPLYLVRGTLTSVGSASVTVHVRGGNRRTLRLLVGQPRDQSFATGPETIFLHWQGKAPTVIDASGLKVGDRVVVRVRVAAGSTLAQVEATPAVHVADREPRQR